MDTCSVSSCRNLWNLHNVSECSIALCFLFVYFLSLPLRKLLGVFKFVSATKSSTTANTKTTTNSIAAAASVGSASSVEAAPMSDSYDDTHAPPPPFLLHRPPLLKPAFASPLLKQRSWSPDAYRDEAWLRRKGNWKNRRSKSVTDEDVDELKACIELGFGFESSPETDIDPRLSDTLPALELYYAVNKSYNDSLLPKPPTATPPPPPSSSDRDSTPSPRGSPHSAIFGNDDDPQTVKTRLRQWAQVVACAVRQSSS